MLVCEGLTETLPDVPERLKPVPVQFVAFVLLQVRVADCPDVIDAGDILSVAVGEAAVGAETPPPERAIDRVELLVVSRNESVPVRFPIAVGVKVTDTVQEPVVVSEAQVLVWEKSPVVVMFLITDGVGAGVGVWVGAGTGVGVGAVLPTVTVALALADPPLPVQVMP